MGADAAGGAWRTALTGSGSGRRLRARRPGAVLGPSPLACRARKGGGCPVLETRLLLRWLPAAWPLLPLETGPHLVARERGRADRPLLRRDLAHARLSRAPRAPRHPVPRGVRRG